MTQIFDKLYRPDEVAKILGINKRTVYRMVRRNEIKMIPESSPWRIPADEIKRILAKRSAA